MKIKVCKIMLLADESGFDKVSFSCGSIDTCNGVPICVGETCPFITECEIKEA